MEPQIRANNILKTGGAEEGRTAAEVVDGILKHLQEELCVPCDDDARKWIHSSVAFAASLMFKRLAGNTDKKIRQKAEKILQECCRLCPDFVKAEVSRNTLSTLSVDVWNHDDLLIWSSIVENSPSVVNILETAFPTFLEKFYATLKHLVNDSLPMPSRQQQLHASARLFLHVVQFVPKTVLAYVWDKFTKENLNVMEKILQIYMCLMMDRESPRDLKLLIGMSISLLITMCPSSEEASKVFFKIFKNIGENVRVTFGNMILYLQLPNDKTKEDVDVDFASISLINGLLLSSMSKTVVLEPVADSQSTSFLVMIFPSVCRLARSKYVYNGFQLLHLWYQSFIRCGFQQGQAQDQDQGQDQGQGQVVCSCDGQVYGGCSQGSGSVIPDRLFLKDSNMTKETLQLIWTNWDNPVKGVPEFVAKIFTCLLQCNRMESRTNGGSDDLLTLVKEKIMRSPWNTRGKHRLLMALLEFVSSQDLLRDYPEIPSELAQCLLTSFLASLSSDVYKVFMDCLKKEIKGDEKRRKVWTDIWMNEMVAALTSDSPTHRYNASHFWVPLTLKTLPEVLCDLDVCLHQHLNDPSLTKKKRNSYLYAWVAVMKTARNQNLVASLDKEPLREVLYHCDDDLRSDAFVVLCCSPKKSEPLFPLEMMLLRECLPLNLNIDNARFRQRLIFSLKSVFIRIRDSCLAMLKSLEKKKRINEDIVSDSLMKSIDFLDWLWKLCIKSIHPGASYQRLITVLDIIEAVFTTFTFSKQSARKAFTPVTESVTKLLDFGANHGMLDFYSSSNVKALLCCMMEETVEIQELSCRLLLTYFPWPLHLDQFTDEEVASHMLSHGLKMCRKPKGQHSASGANMCNFIFSSYAVGLNWKFSRKDSTIQCERPIEMSSNKNDGPIQFIELLIEMTQEAMKQAEADVLQASVCNPGHGYIQALRLCLASNDKSIMENSTLWKPCIDKVIDISTAILHNMLYLLGGKSDYEGMAPSFAQMGTAISSMIQQTESGEEEGVVLSDEFQHVMTWCWISIKECSLLLGNLPGCLGSANSKGVLDVQDVERIGEVLMKILTNCRHRGAIEGCNYGFVKFMSSLLMSGDAKWNRLPGQYLEKILSAITSPQSLSSVTRRSAGLPLLIQSITSCETKLKQTKLFDEALQTLLHIAKQPYCESDQTIDIPQVIAMNVMETLFKDATRSLCCLRFVSDAVILTISSFSSPSWATRNAALHLFGSLLMRMFGQKKMEKFSFSSTTTVEEFFSLYPNLQPFLLSQLQEVVTCTGHKEEGRLLHPSVFPLLAILSRLAPSSHQNVDMAKKFRTPVLILLGSPVYQVRELAATTSVVFISDDERQEFLANFVKSLPENWSEQMRGAGANHLHGKLLLVQKLLYIQRDALDKDFTQVLYEKAWLAGQDNPCFLLRSLYLEILLLLPHCELETIKYEDGLLDGSTHPTHLLVGKEQVQRSLSKHLLRTESASVIETCMKSGLHEVREQCIHCLQEMMSHKRGTLDFWCQVEENLFNMILTETRGALLQSCLELIRKIHESCAVHSPTCPSEVKEKLKAMYTQERVTGISGSALVVMAIILERTDLQETSRSDLNDWSQAALRFSYPTQTEPTRLQAARALVIGSCTVLNAVMKHPMGNQDVDCVISIFDAATSLLQDESSDVRQEITRVVTSFSQELFPGYQSFQFNSAMQTLLFYFVENFSKNPAFILHILEKVMSLPSVDDILQGEDQEMRISSLFEQEEFNIFAEKTSFHSLLCDLLKDMLRNADQLPEEVVGRLKKVAVSLDENMRKAIEYLQRDLSEHPVFNALLNQKVFHTVTSFQRLSRLLPDVLAGSSCDEETVASLKKVSKELAVLLGAEES